MTKKNPENKGFFKSRKIAPDHPKSPTQYNNFFDKEASNPSGVTSSPNGTFYFFRLGSADFFMNKMSPDQKDNESHGLIEMDASFNHKKMDFGPLSVTDFHNSELAAFRTAAQQFSAHAVTIFKVVMPENKYSQTNVFNQQMLDLVKPDIFKFVESVKGMSTKDYKDSVQSQKFLDNAAELIKPTTPRNKMR